ncbi:hypothetical protein JHK82_018247 [Glycine max]|uniref:Uncharacterized protein n=2 Tax=Glycine subgen. Soja TaxID=1462606 RepID=A0A0R0J2R5_SOYBN|nr:hypothetical protein JHK87_018138 [Glycine soja]KAG5022330.1 hypothetical protein JHK85_018672 [Glycine max]KAG5037431.1 hypothetical protein JHK86_018271 [Glycine max]KAG5142552.1 hypothetical protein JHK82_018247 [Glycine max]KAH1086419.1 hypothetical protein GYH30_018095 [Glycine max]
MGRIQLHVSSDPTVSDAPDFASLTSRVHVHVQHDSDLKYALAWPQPCWMLLSLFPTLMLQFSPNQPHHLHRSFLTSLSKDFPELRYTQ